jgi:hypothetical protein
MTDTTPFYAIGPGIMVSLGCIPPDPPELVEPGHGAVDLNMVVAIVPHLTTLPNGTRNRAVIPGLYVGPIAFGPDGEQRWAALPALPDTSAMSAEAMRAAVMPWATAIAALLPPSVADGEAVADAYVAAMSG